MSKSPLAVVKEKFGDKSKLVAALSEFTKNDLWVDRVNKNKTIERVANAKLLRLHRVFTEVKEKFGSRGKLIDAICDMEKRSKDAGFRKRLEAHPVPRLYDAYQAAARRQRATENAGKRTAAGASSKKASAAAAPAGQKATAAKPRAGKPRA